MYKKYFPKEGIIIDPFANEHSIRSLIPPNLKYISNDLDEEFESLYVNVIPVEANAVLMRDGGPERYKKEADGKGKGGF